jgi:hypothetical protein
LIVASKQSKQLKANISGLLLELLVSQNSIYWIKNLKVLDNPKLEPFLKEKAEDIFPRLMISYDSVIEEAPDPNEDREPMDMDSDSDDGEDVMVELSDSNEK